MKFLISGFEPFQQDKSNPSFDALYALPNQIDGKELIKLQLPTVFYAAAKTLRQAIHEQQPDVIIMCGLAGGSPAVRLEKTAINWIDARIADNAGKQPKKQYIMEQGADGYFATLDIPALLQALHEAQIPAVISYSAGTYVCNNVYYETLHDARNSARRCLFVHVPYTPDMVIDKPSMPSMSLTMITQAIETIIRVCE